MAVTLINVFIVPTDKKDAFLKEWKATTDVFRKKPGFIETHLHQNTGVGNSTFSFVNIARWTTAEEWRSTHDDYEPTEYSVPGVKGHAAIFETCIDVYSDSRSESEQDGHWIAASGL